MIQGKTQANLSQNSPVNKERRNGHLWWPQAERGPLHFTLHISALLPSLSSQHMSHVQQATHKGGEVTPTVARWPLRLADIYTWRKLTLHAAFWPLFVSSCLAQLLERSQYEASHLTTCYASIMKVMPIPCLSSSPSPLKLPEAT